MIHESVPLGSRLAGHRRTRVLGEPPYDLRGLRLRG